MHGLPAKDGSSRIDWSLTSKDYARFRPGYPESFFRRLAALGVGLPGQRIADLGTGTGVLARRFAAAGAEVAGVDVAEGQVDAARALAEGEGLSVDLRVAPAEDTGLEGGAFDVVTASQCWLYFDEERAAREVMRLLGPGGRLLTCHLCWLPGIDRIARLTEALVLEHNPGWTAAGWSGRIPAEPPWAGRRGFHVAAMFYYDEPLAFTHETWRGRIRACRGVGASLDADAVERFDEDLTALLRREVEEEFFVLHRIDAHILAPGVW